MRGGRPDGLWPRDARPFKSVVVRIYYEDTDFSGFVYHASYLRFFERGRTEFLRELDYGQRAAFESGVEGHGHFAVRRMAIDFARPARMDDLLTIDTGVGEMTGATIQMFQRASRGQETIATASADLCFVRSGRARKLPGVLLARLTGKGSTSD